MKTVYYVIVILSLASSLAIAAATAVETGPTPSPRPVSPMMTEISAAMTASRDAVAEVSLGLAEADDQDEILAIQREITGIKNEARLETYRIQLRYAEAEGRTEAVARLERLLTDLAAPRTAGTPVRTAPASAGSR